MTETITIRAYADEDQPRVLDLLRASLGETPLLRRTPELFDWKHIRNPFGRSLMLVAEAGERIVGFRAFMKWDLKTPTSHTVKCVRPVDTATHPDFQRQGIFRRLTLEAVDQAREEGVDLIFNTPNPRSGAGYANMGWTEVGAISVMARPSLAILGRSGGREKQDLGSESLKGYDLISRPPVGLRTPRTTEYINWRFHSHPTVRYSVVRTDDAHAAVRQNIRNGRRELIISELGGTKAHRAVTRARKAARPQYTVASFAAGTPERAAAMRAGMIPIPGMRALTLYARPLQELEQDPKRMKSWDLSLGDLELL